MIKYINYGWLSRVGDDALVTDITAILDALTNNPSFPTTDPTLAAIRALLTEFLSRMSIAKQGGKLATEQKNAARAALVVAMQELGQSIETTADGDYVALLSTKYPLVKERTKVGIQPAPANLVLKQGLASGSLTCRTEPNSVMPIFEWQSATGSSPATWTDQPPTKSARTLMEGYTPGTLVHVRVRQRVPAGVSDWSTVVSMIVV